MTDLHEAAENIAAMERSYKAVPVPAAPDVRRCVDEMRELEPTNPHTRAGTVAIAALAIACLLAGVYL